MKKIAILLTLAVIFISLVSCGGTDVYEKLNEMVSEAYSSLTVDIKTEQNGESLSSKYVIENKKDTTEIYYNIRFFSIFTKDENGNYTAPDSYQKQYIGTVTLRDGEIIKTSGFALENAELISFPSFSFDERYFSNVRDNQEDGIFSADVINPLGFTGKSLRCSNMKLEVYYKNDNIHSMKISYLSQNGIFVKSEYSFSY